MTEAATTSASATTTETAVGMTEQPQVEPTVLVENGASDYFVINARTASSEVTVATREFISSLEKKTGVKLKLYPESYAETECEILVGMVHSRASAMARMKVTDYTSWSIFQEGKKLIVTAYDEEGVKLALNELLAHIEEQDGRWVITSALNITGTTNHISPLQPSVGERGALIIYLTLGERAADKGNGKRLCRADVEPSALGIKAVGREYLILFHHFSIPLHILSISDHQ